MSDSNLKTNCLAPDTGNANIIKHLPFKMTHHGQVCDLFFVSLTLHVVRERALQICF